MHLTEEDLVLHELGDGGSETVRAHLDECARCRAELDALRRDLELVGVPEPPPRDEEYGARVWARLSPRLARETPRHRRSRVLAPLALAASLVLAFLLGRHWPHAAPAPLAVSETGRERILLVAVGDHLERSEMLLVELANAGGDGRPVDISTEQHWAEELVGANRLYRQTALKSGEPGVASVLDELERLLVEVAHRPSSLTPDELTEIRRRIESRGLLFRVRVIESQVRDKEKESTRTQASKGQVVS
jgi:anti-sigma factor RsiW